MSIKIEHVSHLYGEGEAFEKKALDDVTLEPATIKATGKIPRRDLPFSEEEVLRQL